MIDFCIVLLQQVCFGLKLKIDLVDLEYYGCDWIWCWMLVLLVIVLLVMVEEVQVVMCWSVGEGVVVVLFGGCIGFFGGVVVVNGELVFSLEWMNKVLVYDVVDCMLVVQVGMLLEVVYNVVLDYGLIYLVDFVVCGLCMIGGNIVINVGGIWVICYGNICEWIVGLKVVIVSGELFEFNKGLIKNFSGYDFCQLLIGLEGMLGVIVEVMVKLIDLLLVSNVMLLVLFSFEVLMQVFVVFCVCLQLQVFEFFIDWVLEYVLVYGVQVLFDEVYLYYVVIEFVVNDEVQEVVVMVVFEDCMGNGWVSDGVISVSDVQVVQLWCLCEGIIELLVCYKFYKNDVLVWILVMLVFLVEIQVLIGQVYLYFDVVWFGYIGDGNLYINVFKLDDISDVDFVVQCEQVIKLLVQVLVCFDGSILVEYGIGLVKKGYLDSIRGFVEIVFMKVVKCVFDF